jgi:hypothetical protein
MHTRKEAGAVKDNPYFAKRLIERLRLCGFEYYKDTAIGLAAHEARRGAHQGLDVVICIQRKDGRFALEWSSP